MSMRGIGGRHHAERDSSSTHRQPVSVFLPIINPKGLAWDRTLVSAEPWHDPTLMTKQTYCLS